MANDSSNYTAILKDLNTPEMVADATYKFRPGIGILPKSEAFGGEVLPIPIKHAHGQMRSHTFSSAQTTSKDNSWKQFQLTPNENHSLAHVTSKDAARSEGKTKAYISIVQDAYETAQAQLADSNEFEIFRDENCVLGAVGTSGITTTVLTLADAHDVVNFELNMEVVGAATTTGAIRTGSATVTGIDRSAGTLTTDSNWTSQITSFTDDDSIFALGDAPNAGNSMGLAGLASWIPSSAPSASENFFGVDRSVDDRLYGTVYDASGDSGLVVDALLQGESKVCRLQQAKLDCFVVNNAQYRKAKQELGAKKEYVQTQAKGAQGQMASVYYTGIQIEGDGATGIAVIPANKCQSNIAWGLQEDLWKLCSIGPLHRVDDLDGQDWLRRSAASGMETRWVTWANPGCQSPGKNVRVTLAAA